jgi:hypothetical protein
MITEQERKRRRLTARLVQLALIVFAVILGVGFFTSRRGPDVEGRIARGSRDISISTDVPTATQLGPGDMQLFNEDSTVDLILQGRTILAGLSPQTVERIRSKMRERGDREGDSSGLGAMIAATVRDQVADKIGTHVTYSIDEIREIRLEGDRLVMEWNSGRQQQLFESVKIDRGRGDANRFRRDEALRFIELVNARKKQPNP